MCMGRVVLCAYPPPPPRLLVITIVAHTDLEEMPQARPRPPGGTRRLLLFTLHAFFGRAVASIFLYGAVSAPGLCREARKEGARKVGR